MCREQDKEATVYIGNLDERVSDSLVWELMLQAGRIVNVHLPKDRVTQTHQGYGFVEFISEEDAEYAARIMNQVRLYGKPIRVNKASADKQKTVEVGAELFVGNLDPMVTEQTLYDTFGRFGSLISAPKVIFANADWALHRANYGQVARDDANLSKGYGFISLSNFEASDEAIANMNGQYLMNKEISVQYAYKKDGKGERHGDQAERMLAAQARKHNVQPTAQPLPAGLFSGGAPSAPAAMMDGDAGRPGSVAGFVNGRPAMQNGNYQGVPPPQQQQQRPPPPSQPLPAPPSGLPARPPPSQAGYGGPQGFLPPGFNQPQQQQNYPPQGAPPPQGFAPPGFGPPPSAGPPPGMPPGFQPPGYGRAR